MRRCERSRMMHRFWTRLRCDDPAQFEAIKARRRATWAAKRLAKGAPPEGRTKAVVVNEAEVTR